MKKIYLFWALCLFSAMNLRAGSQQLTVYDGTATSNMVPMALSYCDSWTQSQCVIPASLLTEMSDGEIYAIQFYTTDNSSFISKASINLVMWESDSTITSLSGFRNFGQPNATYSGKVDFILDEGEIRATIQFDTPLPYNGGCIVIDAQNPNQSWSDNVSFYGQNVSGASWAGYNPDVAYVSGSQQNFAPKITFYYEKEEEPVDEREVVYSVELKDFNADLFQVGADVENVTLSIMWGLSFVGDDVPYDMSGIVLGRYDESTAEYEWNEEWSTLIEGTYRVELAVYINEKKGEWYRFPNSFADEGVPSVTVDGKPWIPEYSFPENETVSMFYFHSPDIEVKRQSIDNVQTDKVQSTKVLRNGQLMIERNGQTYNALGAQMK